MRVAALMLRGVFSAYFSITIPPTLPLISAARPSHPHVFSVAYYRLLDDYTARSYRPCGKTTQPCGKTANRTQLRKNLLPVEEKLQK